MAKLEFESIRFEEDPRSSERLRLVFLRVFEMHIEKADLLRIGRFEVSEGVLDFPELSENELHKFNNLLENAFHNLHSVITGNKAVYVHQNSGIPLIGTLYFGIVDRGTNILEVKPITGCNIDCVFCSVDSGKKTSRLVDFVVEDEYLVTEVRGLVDYKKSDLVEGQKIDVFVNTHGEPLLYAGMKSLIAGLRALPEIGVISVITNGTLLTPEYADELISAGLSQLNLSLNAIDPAKAKELAGTPGYNVDAVLSVARHVASKIKLVVAPVWISGLNDDEIPKIIEFCKEVGAEPGIQNYMLHKTGRKVAKEVGWEEFYARLDSWEKQTGMKLRTAEHTLFKTKPLEKPFRKGDIVRAEVVCPGRMKKEVIAAAQGRCISVVGCYKVRGPVKVRILRDKDNVFVGEEA
ncbi:radical SAM protein [Candidatus Woesearchaeota archaeon]|nr:radical SAM protein [Candidatus Woesearchaeota archaeon]